MSKAKRIFAAALAAAALGALGLAPATRGAASDPLFVFTPGAGTLPPPVGYFEGACGLAVDPSGRLYVADYYHDSIDVYSGGANHAAAPTDGAVGYEGHLGGIDPHDGPCGLALDPGGRLYANDYHRAVLGYTAFPSLTPTGAITGAGIDATTPTGIAVDPAGSRLYVDQRTYAAAYTAAGEPVEVEGEPLRIGLNPLADYYGAAVSAYSATEGDLYLPDAATETVKVFDPAGSATTPVRTISGPPGGFKSLRESAVAVDDKTGVIYVADNLQPTYTERPEAAIYAFSAAGAYLGRLKYNLTDALPPGLAVDNSAQSTQGRVYVTSGNGDGDSVFAYPAGAQTNVAIPVSGSAGAGSAATGSLSALTSASGPAPGNGGAAAFAATVKQADHMQVSLSGQLSPRRLPRSANAPVAVSVGWKIQSTDGSVPTALKALRIEINRNGVLDLTGLPTCPYTKIQPASTSRALAGCRGSLVGRGHFAAMIGIGGQEPYEARGQMLLFNGRKGGKPVLLGQIYSPRPFANSFVIDFKISRISHGTFGTVLSAVLPASLRSWGTLTEIQMRLARTFNYKGSRRSFLSASCPAPKGFTSAPFSLARAHFLFSGGEQVSSILSESCRVR
jgi:sugar lactone lactonase YvrE